MSKLHELKTKLKSAKEQNEHLVVEFQDLCKQLHLSKRKKSTMIVHHYSCNLCQCQLPDDGHAIVNGLSIARDPIHGSFSFAQEASGAKIHICSFCFHEFKEFLLTPPNPARVE